MNKTDKPVIVEQTFNANLQKVWNAITEPGQMRQWFFENMEAFEPVVGFETQFNVQSGERNFIHLWKLTEVIPLKKITYNWKYEDYPGDSFVTFELFEQNGKTLLRLTSEVIEDFPDDITEFKRESCQGSWDYFIKQRLKDYLERDTERPAKAQPNNPLHGVKLVEILDRLVADYGFEVLGSITNIRCFSNNPTIKSSLKFLRKTPWAREKVERLYVRLVLK